MHGLFHIFLSVVCVALQQMIIMASANSEYIIVDTELGKIRGAVKELDDGKKVNQFFGIPFAKPPVGELRWKEPEPVEKWNDLLDASKLYPPHCPQSKVTFSEEVEMKMIVPGPMDEDCLYLNIYAPASASPKSMLSVMVSIHGGGFGVGTALNADGTFVAALDDVVVVTINYRLGLLGFAHFPGTGSEGNYGMFDQILALKWVKDNIGHFGGNPNSVTIYGCSAGGASVSLLTLSPLSKGLFQRAVAESGVASAFWSATDSQNYTGMQEVGSLLNCTDSKIEEFLKCFREKTVEELLEVQEKIATKQLLTLNPRVDGKFLPDLPINLLESGQIHDVDQIIGVCEHEGDWFMYVMNMTTVPVDTLVNMFASKEPQAVRDAIIHEYTQYAGEISTDEIWMQGADFIHDYMFASPAQQTAHLVSKAGKNVHFYVFAHRNKHTVYPDWVRVSHGEEINYAIVVPLNISSMTFYTTRDFTEMEKGLSLSVMKMWSNFAKTGNPSVPKDGVEWPRFSPEDPAYLKISLQPEVKRNLNPKTMAFWNEYLPKLRKHLNAQKAQPQNDDSAAEVKDEL